MHENGDIGMHIHNLVHTHKHTDRHTHALTQTHAFIYFVEYNLFDAFAHISDIFSQVSLMV